ncbi:MAG TPA: hypothetical protein VK821_01340 [Dehalococcoidia bacterium]|nr:hypothetical protein [Dehalococcoidia bacterium]
MSTTRGVRPTDLVALVSLDGRVYPNEARTWESLGRRPEGPRLLDSALVPWFSFATGRHTWISVQGQAIYGLVSARQRGNRTAWEIDCLIAASDDERLIGNLFDQATAEAGSSGVLRIFLRLEAGSGLTSLARRAGFIPYAEESLYRGIAPRSQTVLPPDLHVEPSKAADAFALYRLYNAAVPESIRRIEAPSFQLWQGASERRTMGRARRSLIARRDGEAVAHVRTSRDGELAKVDLVVHPSTSSYVRALVDLACEHAGSQRPLFCLVPSYATPLATSFEEAGFELDSEYVVLVKRTALPLPAAKPVAAQAAPHPMAAG